MMMSTLSSDSDDIDEDELLQIALKDQSLRQKQQHTKRVISSSSSSSSSSAATSKPSKPVLNLVQMPKQQQQQPKQQQQQQPKQQPRKPSVDADDDDDDDSEEVEMLSISSGDEDSVKDRSSSVAAAGKNRGRGGGARDDASDREWDGSDPSCWKNVDEAELVRRVREMRETKAVPVISQAEQKKSAQAARKGLTSLTSFPRGMECVDPLGLGMEALMNRIEEEVKRISSIEASNDELRSEVKNAMRGLARRIIDNKTLRLIIDSSGSAETKFVTNLNLFLAERLNYFSEKFDAKLFLSRIHQRTSAADLEAGALALKSDLEGRTQQKKTLSQAEKIRSVQGMLQRFRTLFNLPSLISRSIDKGEYDLAVREYLKAKSIALPSHVGILKRVLEEVEKIMQYLKGRLYKSMEDPEINLADLENTVRLLLELEPGSDPVWHYLNIQNQRIRGLLERCTIDHEARMEALHNKIRERALSDARWRQIQQDSNNSLNSDLDNSLLGESHLHANSEAVELSSEEMDALRGRYIRRLTSVIIQHIPAFWKAVLSIFSGKFAKSSQVVTEASVKNEDKISDAKYSGHSLDEVAGMIRSTISAYEVKVHSTFRDLEETNILLPYMSDAIKEIFRACEAIEGKESSPPTAVTTLRALRSEMTKIYILRLCSWMRSTAEEISKLESWVPVSILERNKSTYTISSLPLALRAMMTSAMDQIVLMIQSLRKEAEKLEGMFGQLQEIQESVRIAFLNCFVDFTGHLEQLAAELTVNKSSKDNAYLQNGFSRKLDGESCGLHPGSIVSDPHQKLLIVLSNIGYCKDELSKEMYNKYKHIWLLSRQKDEEDADKDDLVKSFLALEEKVLAQYTFAKANSIRVAAENYLLDAGIQWGAAPAVKGVRDAALELLHTLVAVHAEVFAGAKPLLDKTLSILVEGLIDTFLSLFHENEAKNLKSLDPNGFCQLMLELEYFETILHPYITTDAGESLKSLQAVLLEKATESVTDISENPGHNRRPTRGSEDALGDERNQGMTISPDDLLALAQQFSSELLQAEMVRTRINATCFAENMTLDAVPEPVKSVYSSFRSSMDSPSYRGAQAVGSPSFSRQRRR
ncbi:hypothetical protein Syun_013799 [Stephania yunnanensis]|uniref:Exocyst complex component SEC5 n=1 Tax=Stephania yunnanensis TaxID=152371 RepID=A0AAP0P900_9MAGN